MEDFSISVSLSIQPETIRTQIIDAFIAQFGPPGTDEFFSEFMERKLEEYTLQIFKMHAVNQAMKSANEQTASDVDSAARIKQRKDKPVEKQPDLDVLEGSFGNA